LRHKNSRDALAGIDPVIRVEEITHIGAIRFERSSIPVRPTDRCRKGYKIRVFSVAEKLASPLAGRASAPPSAGRDQRHGSAAGHRARRVHLSSCRTQLGKHLF
jgi:hypothetical protein